MTLCTHKQLTGNDELIPSDPGFSHKGHFFFPRPVPFFLSIKAVFLSANLRGQCLSFHFNSSREIVQDTKVKRTFFAKKKFFLFERKGFGRGDEFSPFLGQLGTQF